jgi:hypothetical protein
VTDAPALDWSAIYGAVEHLEESGLSVCAEAVQALERHDTASAAHITTLADSAARAVKLLDKWLGWHGCEHEAELVAAARELLINGEPT